MKLFLLAVLAGLPGLTLAQTSTNQLSTAPNGDLQAALVFTGGHDTDPRDRGRPVVLIAAALNVSPDVFRQAFSNVKPAGPGQQPQPDQVRKNKQVLMVALGPYGVTDDRLNRVSNYYRYSRSRGEMWSNTSASGYATVHNGVVTGVTVTNPGSGYSSTPGVAVAGMPDVCLNVTLAFGTDFAKNGSIQNIKVGGSASTATP